MLHIAQVATPADIASARELLREYIRWAMEVFQSYADTAPTFQGVDRELATLPGVYAPPDGRLLLASLDERPAGCIALRRHDASRGEIKRLYVRPEFRGHNIGAQLVSTLISAARDIGFRRLVLDSHQSMTRSHDLYRQAGFRVVAAPEDCPAHLKPVVVFMEMDLV